MSKRIYLADKLTQDSIKQDTSNILRNFPIKGIFDPSNYAIRSSDTEYRNTSLRDNNWVTVYSISGPGYISYLSLSRFSTIGRTCKHRLTIDGKVYYEGEGLIEMVPINPVSPNVGSQQRLVIPFGRYDFKSFKYEAYMSNHTGGSSGGTSPGIIKFLGGILNV